MHQPGINRLARSNELLSRAEGVIPGQTNTISKRLRSFGAPDWFPAYARSAQGSRLTDVDGNVYLDYIAALAPVILGYRNEAVDAAIRAQLEAGILMSLPTESEVVLSELLTQILPSAEKVRLFKTGAEAVSAAVRCARLATGRELILSCGYSGWHDWWAVTQSADGIPRAIGSLTMPFDFDDLVGAESLMSRHGGLVAAIVVTPAVYGRNPTPGFLQGLRDLCDHHGALLVFDEIITGFRWSLAGAQGLFGVVPDLTALGKAMANGMPLAALVGRNEPMQKLGENWVTSTNASEALSIAAALATIHELSKPGFYERLYVTSAAVVDCIKRAASSSGVELRVSEALPAIRFELVDTTLNARRDTLLEELVAEGILIRRDKHGFSMCLMDALVPADIVATEQALGVAFRAISSM